MDSFSNNEYSDVVVDVNLFFCLFMNTSELEHKAARVIIVLEIVYPTVQLLVFFINRVTRTDLFFESASTTTTFTARYPCTRYSI